MFSLKNFKHLLNAYKNTSFRLESTKESIVEISAKRNKNFKENVASSQKDSKLIYCHQDFTELLQAKIEKERERLTKFKKDYGTTKLAEITVNQLYGGMRGMLGFVCDTSYLDPEEGIRFRGFTLSEVQQKLPKAKGGKEPLPEGIFWLLVTGDIPSKGNVEFLSRFWAENCQVPEYAEKIIKCLPTDLHPMTQFSISVNGLNKNSKFNMAYDQNVPRFDIWKYILADSLDLLAKLPSVAAMIYNNTFNQKQANFVPNPYLDWSANFAQMLDHEGGNVSAHACNLVGSAHVDPYLAFAAALNGLAGPSKMVIPGYGHVVLRKTDPRFLCQMDYAQRVIPHDPMVQLVAKVYKVLPPVLQSLGKVRNPCPNVDAHSGVLLRHFGLNETSFYTVLFGVSRALGLMAQLIWARALMLPIERPDTITTDLLMKRAVTAGIKEKSLEVKK